MTRQNLLPIRTERELLPIPVQLDMPTAALRQDLHPDVVHGVGLHVFRPLSHAFAVYVRLVREFDLIVPDFQRERDIRTPIFRVACFVFFPLKDRKPIGSNSQSKTIRETLCLSCFGLVEQGMHLGAYGSVSIGPQK